LQPIGVPIPANGMPMSGAGLQLSGSGLQALPMSAGSLPMSAGGLQVPVSAANQLALMGRAGGAAGGAGLYVYQVPAGMFGHPGTGGEFMYQRAAPHGAGEFMYQRAAPHYQPAHYQTYDISDSSVGDRESNEVTLALGKFFFSSASVFCI